MITLFAHAGGLIGRSDLPIPEWLFGWAAAMVLVISFVALAILWPEPKLEGDRWRPLPGGRVLASRVVEIVCGAIGIGLLGVVVYTGLEGTQSPAANFAPTFVFVIFWIGLVPASVLFGDIFRAFNPWRALGRAVGWAAGRVVRSGLPAPLAYPERLGHWPAAAGVFAFAVLELVRSGGDQPDTVADRDADLLGAHVHRDGALRRRGVERARRGLLRLLQPVRAHLACSRRVTACSGCGRRWPASPT